MYISLDCLEKLLPELQFKTTNISDIPDSLDKEVRIEIVSKKYPKRIKISNFRSKYVDNTEGRELYIFQYIADFIDNSFYTDISFNSSQILVECKSDF